MSRFHRVLPAAALAEGIPAACDVEGEPVCLVRSAGAVHAFDDRCPHRGTPLSRGTVADGIITCSLHTWQFDVRTGEPVRLRVPDRLVLHETRERGGVVEVRRADAAKGPQDRETRRP